MFIRRNKKTIILVVCLALFLPVQSSLTVKAQSISQNPITDISVGGRSQFYGEHNEKRKTYCQKADSRV